MRLIDLLNIASRGDKLPNKIKVDNLLWEYREDDNDYYCEEIHNYLMDKYNMMNLLNTSVDLVEEIENIII